MTIRKFLIDICGIFLGVSLTESIERLIDEFSILALCSFLIVAFLSLNFFFAKVKQLTEEDEVITLFGFVVHVVTLACFATMAFALNNFILFMSTHIGMRISDILLIMSHNQWKRKNIEKMESRWLIFDISYLLILIIFIVSVVLIKIELLEIIFMIIYLLMSIFEALFDFVINKKEYGMAANEMEKESENNTEVPLSQLEEKT